MVKQELISMVALRTGLPAQEAKVAVEATFEVMADVFAKKNDVIIRGFGTFKYRVTKQKVARNISEGTQVTLPPTPTVKFQLSKLLKDKLS